MRERRNDAFDERHRVVDENTRWLARRGPLDAPAGGIARRGGDAGGLHRRGVGEDCVSVDAGEHDRVVRRDAGERVVRGEAGVAPLVLIPPAADHPAAGRQVLRASADSADDRVVRAGVREVDVVQERAEPEQVGVRVDHAGDHDPAGEIQHLRRRSAQEKRFARRADEGHATAANGHRLDKRMRIVDGVDLRVDENQVRRDRRLALGVGARRIGGADDEERDSGETSHDNHFR